VITSKNTLKYLKIDFGPFDFGFCRLRGCSGMGNLLCTWGEAMLYAKKNNLKVIWPTWPQISFSAIKYKRMYFDVFKNDGTYFSYWEYMSKAALSKDSIIRYGPKIPYNVNWNNSVNNEGDAIWLREKLNSIISSRYKKRINTIDSGSSFIAIHVRRGDFLNPIQHFKDGSGRNVNKAIELNWYLNAVHVVRSKYGKLPVVCISDAKKEELKSLLDLDDVMLQVEHPIVDLLTMSKAVAFVASGSTFSQWISYFGGMETWINKDFTWYSPDYMSSKLHQI
jgi:hypothetical protein